MDEIQTKMVPETIMTDVSFISLNKLTPAVHDQNHGQPS